MEQHIVKVCMEYVNWKIGLSIIKTSHVINETRFVKMKTYTKILKLHKSQIITKILLLDIFLLDSMKIRFC